MSSGDDPGATTGVASVGTTITPTPTDEEAAAIVAAVQFALAPSGAPAPEATVPRWRFSGRWWSQPVPLRRIRPW